MAKPAVSASSSVGVLRNSMLILHRLAAVCCLFALLIPARAVAAGGGGDGAVQPGAVTASTEYLLRDLPGVPDALRQAILAGRKDEALRLARELADHDASQRPFWLLLEGVVLQQAGDHVQALASFARAEELAAASASPWLHKLRFARAASHRALGQWQAVEAIFEAETDRLRSGERQRDLAAVVVAFADESSTPRADAPPGATIDYLKARALYQQVLAMEVPSDLREYAMWRLGYCEREGGDPGQAAQEWEAWLNEWDPAWRAARGVVRARPGERVPERVFEVRLAHALAVLAGSGDAARAARAFEDLDALLRGFLAGEGLLAAQLPVATGAARERLVAMRGEAMFHAAAAHGEAGRQDLRIGGFRRLLDEFPRHARASEAAFGIGVAHAANGRHAEAKQAWEEFLARPKPSADGSGGGVEAAAALALDARLRMKAHALIAESLFALGRYEEAGRAFAAYTALFPTGPDWANAQEGVVRAAYEIGADLLRRREFAAARSAWARFLEEHPLHPAAQETFFAIGELFTFEARAADALTAAALYEAAVAHWNDLAARWPGSDAASHALFAGATLLEEQLGRLPEAIAAYRRCDFGPWAWQARARLERMVEDGLAIRTERVFRGGQTVTVRAETRNLDTLQVEVYPLDLEAYFRKHLSHEGVGGLDLDLIAPTQTFTWTVKDYAPFAPLVREIEIPVEGPGAWAVAVSGKDLRATTLVLRSDLDLLVKSSREELLVLAVDVPRAAGAAGVRLVIASPSSEAGGPQVVELVTGADGVARHDWRDHDGGAPEDLRVYAASALGAASTHLALDGLAVAPGLGARGHVATDRPAYRPGETVHWRAVLRGAERDRYVFRTGEKWRVTLADPLGRALRSEVMELSSFGTLTGSFALAPGAEPGAYVLRCTAPDGAGHDGGFQVGEFELPKAELLLETDRSVLFPGEQLALRATARSWFGEPLPDAPVSLWLPDGRRLDLRTDAEGVVRATFDTRGRDEQGWLQFSARLDEFGIAAAAQAFIAPTGFRASVTTARPLVLAGESFALEVGARDWEDRPVATQLHVTVVRRERIEGFAGESVHVPETWTERVVQELDLTTDAATGLARATLTLESGGDHRLRVLGVDRFTNPVQAEASLQVSGEEDATKLRFVTDRTAVDVGERVRLPLHNRAEAGVGLITFLGNGVLDYRVVPLRKGANEVEFQAAASFWPNFAVAVDLVGERAWHATSIALLAERALTIEVQPAQARWRPGDEVELALVARDQLGNPVQAEIALGAVDHALLALFPDLTPALPVWFGEGVLRRAEMRTATTALFAYVGDVRFVAQEILDERLARDAAEQWELRREEVGRALGEPSSAPQEAAKLLRRSGAEEDALAAFGDELDLADTGAAIGGAGGGFTRGFGGKARAPSAPAAAAAQRSIEGALGEALAHWDARVMTDAQGRATVRFTMPQRSTRWRVLARGVGPDTLLGQSELTIESRADLLVELRTPAQLVEGDRPVFGAMIHNYTGAPGVLEVALELGDGARTWTVPARAEFADDARAADLSFATPADLALPPGGVLTVRVSARGVLGGAALDASATRELPVRAWGTEYEVTAAGTLTSGHSFTLALPSGHAWHDGVLELAIGRGLDAVLVAEALGGGFTWRGGVRAVLPPLRPDLASELIGVSAVLAYAEAGGGAAREDLGALRERAAGLAAALTTAQNRNGSWSWSKGGGDSVETSARALWALCEARARGVHVAPKVIESSVTHLQSALRALPGHALEETAMLLHALARADAADFGVANRLHRSRNEMGAAGLAYTTLALSALASGPMAAEVAALLAERHVPGQGWSAENCRGWHRLRVERTGLALQALVAARSTASAVAAAAEELAAARPWPAGGPRGMALAALAAQRGTAAPARDDFEVAVEVAGRSETLRFAGPSPLQRLAFPLADDATGRVEVRLELRGRGAPAFSARLSASAREIVKIEHADLRVQRQQFLAAPPRLDGNEIQTGFGVLQQSREEWQNVVAQCEFGGEVIGAVQWMKRWNNAETELDGEFLLLDVPLPRGTRLVPGSVSGNFESYEEEAGVLRVRIGRTRNGGSVHYRLAGTVPGEWRVAPATLRSAYDPGRRGDGVPGALTVLARGVASDEAYRVTPDEFFHTGKALYAAGDLAGAAVQLQALMDGWERDLRDDVLREAAEMLLYSAIARADAPLIVRSFEILREKSPELTIPFAQVIVVGRAYRELGEHERAARIFQAVIEETFGKDLRVAGVLEQHGDFVGAADALYRLWLEYPDLPAVSESALTLADKLLRRAPDAHLDPALAQAGYDRAALIGVGVQLLRAFQSLYARDPLAADAGLNLVSAHLDLQDYEDAARLAAEMAGRFVEPRWSDTFAYTEAVADWYLGRDEQAVGLLRRIAEAVYVGGDGAETRSANRELALYILGQIHHARQEFGAAAEFYEQVAEVFSDAREALADFREKRLTLEEVTTTRPGVAAIVKVGHRNLAEAEVLVYPVDLLTLTLRERNLAGVTGVNLSGIAPTMRLTLPLSAAASLRPQTSELRLDLPGAGAYLVMLRGEELHASGLVLVSDLEIEVREDAQQGRLRVQAIERGSGDYLREVDVRVIGSGNARFSAGKTDPRGIFVADGLAGTSTVIARWNEQHFAFFRGEQVLGPTPGGDYKGPSDTVPGQAQQLEADDYLSNVMQENAQRQQGRSAKLRSEMDKDRAGVQVIQVK
jgi:tetratricopeptide (TPR) repeat protein